MRNDFGLFARARRFRRSNNDGRADRVSAVGEVSRRGVVEDIALGVGEESSPALLLASAQRALGSGDGLSALNLARRVRDRNDDFVNALPSMSGRKPLRDVIYHPDLYSVMIDALDMCAASRAMSAVEIADVACAEQRWMGRDYSAMYGSGDEAYWHLYLSDYFYLFALAFASGVQPSDAEASERDGSVAQIVADRAGQVPCGSLTREGEQAKAKIFALVGRPQPPRPASFLARPRGGVMPCGALISQDEIVEWLTCDRDARTGLDMAEADLPTYDPNRARASRPPRATPADLRALALEQVGYAYSRPDAWWDAVDFGLYRWEMIRHFDTEATDWVRSLVYDLYALKERGAAPDTPMWDWKNLIEVARYCLDRVEALLRSIDPDCPDDRRAAQSSRNYFAWMVYECMRASGSAAAWNAFEPQLYAVLNESHPQALTAAQFALLPVLREKYGTRDVHA